MSEQSSVVVFGRAGEVVPSCPSCARLKAENERLREVVEAARSYTAARDESNNLTSGVDRARKISAARYSMFDAISRLAALDKEGG